MAIDIVTTVGSASANAYATTDYITDYAPGTAWAAAWEDGDDDARDVWNVRAARALDTLPFPGRPTDIVQAMQWPRAGVEMPQFGCYDSTAIPAPILRAHAHLACYLASLDDAATDPFSIDATANVKREKVGPLETEYFGNVGTAGNQFLATVIAPMLRPWGLLGPAGTVRLVR